MRDPLAIIDIDAAHSQLEDRFRVIGADGRGHVLVVAVAEVDPDTARIMSARRPTRRERHAYESQDR